MIRLIYRPTALFHFKRLDATNKGALTLPMPTPYAVRCAFLARSGDPEAYFDAVKEKEMIVARRGPSSSIPSLGENPQPQANRKS